MKLEEVNTFGKRVTQLRKEKGWSQRHLGELIGFNRDNIRNLESDRVKNPNRTLLSQLVTVLGTTYEWLEHGKGSKYAVQEETEAKQAYILKIIDRVEAAGLDKDLVNVLRTEAEILIRKDQQWEETIMQLLETINALRKK